VTHECNGRTDGQTDILVAHAALNYIARRKKTAVDREDVIANVVFDDMTS